MEKIALILGLFFGVFLLFGYLLKNYEKDTNKSPEKVKTPLLKNQPQETSENSANSIQSYSNLSEEKTNHKNTNKTICDECGTPNNLSYKFCKNCIEPLL